MRSSALSFTGLVLAGGRGQRMGGADKGWVDYQGRALIEHVIERLAPQVDSLLISANRNVERYGALADTITDDNAGLHIEKFAGPMLGVLAGLRRAQTDWIAIVPCDSPQFPLELVQRLAQGANAERAPAAYVRAGGVMQPLFAIIQTTTAESLAQSIRDGERAMHRWLAALPAVAIDFDDTDAFVNINQLPTSSTRAA
ncbi:MAG: molybdenum cofactor guanylyltransferase MobA [Burkholderiaceae bacterium]